MRTLARIRRHAGFQPMPRLSGMVIMRMEPDDPTSTASHHAVTFAYLTEPPFAFAKAQRARCEQMDRALEIWLRTPSSHALMAG